MRAAILVVTLLALTGFLCPICEVLSYRVREPVKLLAKIKPCTGVCYFGNRHTDKPRMNPSYSILFRHLLKTGSVIPARPSVSFSHLRDKIHIFHSILLKRTNCLYHCKDQTIENEENPSNIIGTGAISNFGYLFYFYLFIYFLFLFIFFYVYAI